jgi:asparagine synthase (glutamine-hydrolysing)
MASSSGRYVTVFNGEIYNLLELREDLERSGEAPQWRGHSDTEILLAACEAWGIEQALKRANGMFAIAILDRVTRQLVLARDRLGEKPLYYGWSGRAFLFASELKALLHHPSFQRRLNSEVLGQYLRFGYVPAPHSIYEGINKLRPACHLRVNLDSAELSAQMSYWSTPLPQASADFAEVNEAVEALDALLREAVRLRLHADVPVGAFLSGGIDSSAIVALAQAESSRPVRTYSIGFRERDHDESAHARAVATVLGTDHTELFVTAQDALAVVPRIADIYDEPFADSSQIPTYLLAKLTRAHVTVAVSGDGGDELFGGYQRYFRASRLAAINSFLPRAARAIGARALAVIPGQGWDRLLSFGPQEVAVQLGGDRISKLAGVLREETWHGIYKRLVSQWLNPAEVAPSSVERLTVLDDQRLAEAIGSPVAWMMHMDQLTYLPDDILVKVDRATMAVALEARVPFLDPRVVEFAARLPIHYKIRGSEGKWLLRRVLYRYVDAKLFRRPKQGFGIPLARWLRGPLREWAEDLLSLGALRETAVFDPRGVRRAWEAHLFGRENLHYPIWVLLMYQAWHRCYRPAL